jgi:integron integrase
VKDIRRPIDPKSTRLIDRLKLHIRSHNLAYTTEKSYVHWILRFIRFHNKQHPIAMGEEEIENFLSHLACERRCSKGTQRVALNALIYLYREFLHIKISNLNYKMASKPRKVPTVFSPAEAAKVLGLLKGKYALATSLIYGSGLRISEVVALRIKDIDFEMNQIVVRSGKGDKDRITLLPEACVNHLKRQMAIVHSIHVEDLANGYGCVYIPDAQSKNQLSSRKAFAWQYLFPSNAIIIDTTNKVAGRHHIDESVIRKKIKEAIKSASIFKEASTHTFRHSFASQCILNGMDIRTLQELLGHASVSTTQIYLHVTEQKNKSHLSPLDILN